MDNSSKLAVFDVFQIHPTILAWISSMNWSGLCWDWDIVAALPRAPSSTLRFAICRMSSTLSSRGLVFSSRLPHVPGQSSRIIRKEGILFISNCFQFPLEVDSKMIASQSTSNPAVGPVLTGVFHFHLSSSFVHQINPLRRPKSEQSSTEVNPKSRWPNNKQV